MIRCSIEHLVYGVNLAATPTLLVTLDAPHGDEQQDRHEGNGAQEGGRVATDHSVADNHPL